MQSIDGWGVLSPPSPSHRPSDGSTPHPDLRSDLPLKGGGAFGVWRVPMTQSPFGASPLLAHVAGLSRAELERLQLTKLRRQLERLYAQSPYYRERMDGAGLKPESITSLQVFKDRFPTSTKADFLADQLAHPPFGARLGIARDQVALVNMTGGTSGQGQEIYGRSQRDIHMQGYLHALPWFLAGLRPGDMAINCVPAGGMTTGGWGPGEGFV